MCLDGIALGSAWEGWASPFELCEVCDLMPILYNVTKRPGPTPTGGKVIAGLGNMAF